MPYVVEKLEDQLMDAIARPEGWVQRDPTYADFFMDLADMRNVHQEQGTSIKTPEWKLVATIQSTLEGANHIIKSDFLTNKRAFFAWLDRNPQYCAYDRRRGRRQ